jgi:hypothetical protein
MKEEELEFISVNQDDDFNNMNDANGDPTASDNNGDSVIGSWFIKQSKA